ARARTWGGFERLSCPLSPAASIAPLPKLFKMITSGQTWRSRNSGEFRYSDQNHLVTLCHFLSIFAKARRSSRNQRQFKALRQGLRFSERPESHKKTPSQFLFGLGNMLFACDRLWNRFRNRQKRWVGSRPGRRFSSATEGGPLLPNLSRFKYT